MAKRISTILGVSGLIFGLLAGLVSLWLILDRGIATSYRSRIARSVRADEADVTHEHGCTVLAVFHDATITSSGGLSGGGDDESPRICPASSASLKFPPAAATAAPALPPFSASRLLTPRRHTPRGPPSRL